MGRAHAVDGAVTETFGLGGGERDPGGVVGGFAGEGRRGEVGWGGACGAESGGGC